MRPSRIIIAPSCSGELTKNRLPISSTLGVASTTVPVLMISPSLVCRSKTISAPVLVRESSAQALAMVAIDWSHTPISSLSFSCADWKMLSLLNRVWATCSSIRRSSG